ncbi:MAG: hypothetical protein V4713_13640 [Pseudomonadota bacterium]
MPSTLFDPSADQVFGIGDHAEFWLYRIGAYLLINVIDDPAWLALMFC